MDNHDCFVIWAHGLHLRKALMQKITEHYYIIAQKQRTFDSVETVLSGIYTEEMKTIPQHIRNKNKHLNRFAPEALMVLVKNRDTSKKFRCQGHGPYNAVCRTFNEHFKQEIRDIFNPKQSNGARTEDHVIHGAENYRQIDATLNIFGFSALHRLLLPECEDWNGNRFTKNAQEQKDVPDEVQLPVRWSNLKLVAKALKKHHVTFWLQGKTLLGLYRQNSLIVEDHDDDIGVSENDRIRIIESVYPLLKREGFAVIRNNRHFLSILKDNRYIDICFFTKKSRMYGYGNKWFPIEYFEKFDHLNINNVSYPIPYRTEELLNHMYPLRPPEANTPIFKKTRKALLRYDDFMDCFIEAKKSINWELRGPHLKLITDNMRVRRVGDLVAMFSDIRNVSNLLENSLAETDTSTLFDEPINLNRNFWQSGNNYFFNCILYGFRKNVVPYNKANQYISSINKPFLYSRDYYEELEKMGICEIEEFLESNPIIVENNSITHGQHRACAMIGLLAGGNEYIPFSLN
jgi:hypothetical protein